MFFPELLTKNVSMLGFSKLILRLWNKTNTFFKVLQKEW